MFAIPTLYNVLLFIHDVVCNRIKKSDMNVQSGSKVPQITLLCPELRRDGALWKWAVSVCLSLPKFYGVAAADE